MKTVDATKMINVVKNAIRKIIFGPIILNLLDNSIKIFYLGHQDQLLHVSIHPASNLVILCAMKDLKDLLLQVKRIYTIIMSFLELLDNLHLKIHLLHLLLIHYHLHTTVLSHFLQINTPQLLEICAF